MTALPSPYYEFFAYVEPALAFIGGLYAWLFPRIYCNGLLPAPMLSMFPSQDVCTRSGVMAVRQLGNCYFLLAMVSFFMLPALTRSAMPQEQLIKTLRTFFGILAVADLTHIFCTFIDLGTFTFYPSTWNSLVHGNTTLVLGLFAWRCAWFSYSSQALKKLKNKAR